MELDKIYENIINGTAILITGSGAHINVHTPDGQDFPSGVSLATRLYEQCGILKPENPWDLQDASETYLEKYSKEKLITEIKTQLMVGGVKEEHKKLYSCNWQRVYTTNYDNVPRISTMGEKETLIPVTLGMKRKDEYLQQKTCIYINGYIERLDDKTLDDEFKLTGKSYLAATRLEDSEWGAVFSEDIETADSIIIVGLSLDYDLDIKRFIYNKNVKNKIVFIEKQGISDSKRRKLERLGDVKEIGMKEFVKELWEYKEKHILDKNENEYIIYKSFSIYDKKNTMKNASTFDVYDLFMRGEIKDCLWNRKDGKYRNIIFREKINTVKNCLNNGQKVIFIHANLGNGKTLFIETLKHQMQNTGIKFYTLEDYFQGITAKEIKRIVEEDGKKIVIIENYYNHMEVIKKFATYNLKNIQFIFSARTVLYDTRLPEVCDILNIEEKNSSIFDINKLNDDEIYQMSKILTINGLWGKKSKYTEGEKKKLLKVHKHGNKELQGILLEVIESSDMKSKIEDIVINIKKMSDKYYETLILALLIKVMSLNISINDMSRILHFNFAVDTLFTKDYNIREILDFTSGEAEYRLKSAVTANTILQELDCNEEIIQSLFKIAKYANKYRQIEKYENALKNIISYSHVKTFLLKRGQKEAFLIKYYNGLKEVDYYKENSFFWLQYSIACTNIFKYNLAQTYLDNAYSFFRESEKTVPFQIDTQQARLNLLMVKNNFVKTDNEIKERFRQAHNLLMKPVVSNKDNPVKQMYVFNLYLDKEIKSRILNAEGTKEYAICCSEAYNKIRAYMKSSHQKYEKNGLENMADGLLQNSIIKTVDEQI